jgi:hypothetical protein
MKDWLGKFIIMENIQIVDVTADFSRYCIVAFNVIPSLQQLGLALDLSGVKAL